MTPLATISPEEILEFWFDAGSSKWWVKDSDFDKIIEDRFASTLEAASAGKLDSWAKDARGALALTIVLDQFSRNLFRGDPRTFAQDHKAREIANNAIASGFDQQFSVDERAFFYTPFMHAEDVAWQNYSVALYQAAGNESGVIHARDHADIIYRFRRFPHRNEVLGRISSPAELAFLRAGGFSG